MKITPISFEKKYKKPRTGKREVQRTQTSVQLQKMSPQEYIIELKKQADFALNEVGKIKQIANSAKIRSYEVADKAKRNKEFADSLYVAIKENPNSANKNFIIQHQGTTYKVELQNGKYRAIGQSRGFFGKKDVFEYEMKKGELSTTILKGYSKETDTYTTQEEYHFIGDGNVKVFFDTATDKFKKAKESFSFILGNELTNYCTNIKTKPDDFEYGEFETIINYSVWQNSKLFSYVVGLQCSKNSMQSKYCWTFSPNGALEGFNKDCYAKSKEKSDNCDVKVMVGFKDGKPINGAINMRSVGEKPSYEFKYEF